MVAWRSIVRHYDVLVITRNDYSGRRATELQLTVKISKVLFDHSLALPQATSKSKKAPKKDKKKDKKAAAPEPVPDPTRAGDEFALVGLNLFDVPSPGGIRFTFVDPKAARAAAAAAAAADADAAAAEEAGSVQGSVEGGEEVVAPVPGGPVVCKAEVTHGNTRLQCKVPDLGSEPGLCKVELVVHEDGGAVVALEGGWAYEGAAAAE